MQKQRDLFTVCCADKQTVYLYSVLVHIAGHIAGHIALSLLLRCVKSATATGCQKSYIFIGISVGNRLTHSHRTLEIRIWWKLHWNSLRSGFSSKLNMLSLSSLVSRNETILYRLMYRLNWTQWMWINDFCFEPNVYYVFICVPFKFYCCCGQHTVRCCIYAANEQRQIYM